MDYDRILKSLNRMQQDIDFVRSQLAVHVIKRADYEHEIEGIFHTVANVFSVQVKSLMRHYKKRKISEARHVVAAMMLEYIPAMTKVDVGYIIGERDHSTISKSIQVFHNLCNYDKIYAEKVQQVRTLIEANFKLKNLLKPVLKK